MIEIPESVEQWVRAGYVLIVVYEEGENPPFAARLLEPSEEPSPPVVGLDGTLAGAMTLLGILTPMPVVPLPPPP